jgi:hypothetical protein
VAPRPTPFNRLGGVLTVAGIKEERKTAVRLRVMPAVEECLVKLWGPGAKPELFEEVV